MRAKTDQIRGSALSAGASIGALAVFAGGYDASTGYNLDVIDIFNFQTGGWTVGKLNTLRPIVAGASACHLFFGTGSNPYNAVFNSDVIEVFNASSRSTTTTKLILPRASMAAVGLPGVVFFAG